MTRLPAGHINCPSCKAELPVYDSDLHRLGIAPVNCPCGAVVAWDGIRGRHVSKIPFSTVLRHKLGGA